MLSPDLEKAPPTFLTRDAFGVVRAFNDQGRRCSLSSAGDGLPIIDIRAEAAQVDGCVKANAEYRAAMSVKATQVTEEWDYRVETT